MPAVQPLGSAGGAHVATDGYKLRDGHSPMPPPSASQSGIQEESRPLAWQKTFTGLCGG